jgi:group I intron endonuclease
LERIDKLKGASMIVYRIYDKETGKSYIGQTSMSLHKRIYGHLHKSESAIGEAMRQRGQENFDVSVIDVCETKKDADRAEKFWIKFYDSINNGYNIHTGGTPDKKWMEELRSRQKGGERKHTKKFLYKQRMKKLGEEMKKKEKPRKLISKKDIEQWRAEKRQLQDEGVAQVRKLMTTPKEPLFTAKEIYQHETEWIKNIAMQQRMFS